jgi:hypothetical protein
MEGELVKNEGDVGMVGKIDVYCIYSMIACLMRYDYPLQAL